MTAQSRVMLIGFDVAVLASQDKQAGWPAWEIVRMAAGGEAIDHVRGTSDVAVVLAHDELSNMRGVKALSRVADDAVVRRILATEELTEDVIQALEAGRGHADGAKGRGSTARSGGA